MNVLNDTNTPDWKVYGMQSWDFQNLGVDLTERWVSAGVFGHRYVVCQSNCPVSTVANPTINYNKMAGAFYVDLGARYTFGDRLAAFVKIDNLFDRDPVAFAADQYRARHQPGALRHAGAYLSRGGAIPLLRNEDPWRRRVCIGRGPVGAAGLVLLPNGHPARTGDIRCPHRRNRTRALVTADQLDRYVTRELHS